MPIADAVADERHPRKQGLKPVSTRPCRAIADRADERHPRKQGLKPAASQPAVRTVEAADERHPRKQGLKPCSGDRGSSVDATCR